MKTQQEEKAAMQPDPMMGGGMGMGGMGGGIPPEEGEEGEEGLPPEEDGVAPEPEKDRKPIPPPPQK